MPRKKGKRVKLTKMDSNARSVSPDITELCGTQSNGGGKAEKGAEQKEKEPQQSAAASTSTSEENDNSKIRRSTRIKKLETSRGGARRREVVFSNNDRESIINRSFDQDDDSNSNSGSGILSSSFSVPNLSSLSITSSSPFGETSSSNTGICTSPITTTTSTHASMLPISSTMKLKSRWRYSLDAESFKSSTSVGTSNTNANVNLSPDTTSLSTNFSSLVGHAGAYPAVSPDTNSSSMAIVQPPKPKLISKPGHILADPSDTELMEKLWKFEGIEENIFLTERYVSKEGRGMVCDCFLTREEISRGEIGCNEDCLNRLLMVECSNRCPTGDRCTNKSFQRKQYCGLEVFQTELKGHGLRTTHPLPEGGFVIEYVGEVLDPREFKQRTREYAKGNQEHFYFMSLKSDAIIDATLRGNCSRFINHSCEPNCETQKWTVNGELRIGFFAIKDLEAGDEITFDYQFQRYGKKAQRCLCMTPSCRGWIGGENEEDTSTAIKGPGKLRLKAERKKKREALWEDIALEEELIKLESTGLRNKIQTLNLCRLMVRAEDWDSRERILNVIIGGDEPCRRLFLDYHGLRLLWAWMLNLPLPSPDAETQLIRNDRYHLLFLKALATLPIPNKTILQDSKVLSVIEKWSSAPSTSKLIIKKAKPEISEATSSDAVLGVTDEAPLPQVIADMNTLENQLSNVDIHAVSTSSENIAIPGLDLDSSYSSDKMELDTTTASMGLPSQELEEPVVQELKWEFVETAKDLLLSWHELKEVFRIPKRERVEQMKQHERAADSSGGLPSLTRMPPMQSLLTGSYGNDSRFKQSRTRFERKVPVLEFTARDRDRYNKQLSRPMALPPESNLSKAERRHLFAEQVAREEEEERNRKTQDQIMSLHQERCVSLGLDVTTVPIVDPNCAFYLEPTTVTWKEIDLNDPALPEGIAHIVQASQYPPEEMVEEVAPEAEYEFPPWPEGLPPPPPLPPAVLPRGWRMAVDDEGRCYYYDLRSRQSQWHPPSPGQSTCDSDSTDSGVTDDDNDETEDDKSSLASAEDSILKVNPEKPRLRLKVSDRSERRKKSGLVQERIISPRDEDEKPVITQKSIRARKLQLMEQKIQQEALEAKGLLGRRKKEERSKKTHGAGSSSSKSTAVSQNDGNVEKDVKEEISTESRLGETEADTTELNEAETTNDLSNDSVTETETVTKLSTQSPSDENKLLQRSPTLPGFSPVESLDTSLTSTTESTTADEPSSIISKASPPSKSDTPTKDDALCLVRGTSAASATLTPALNKLTEKKKAHHRKGKPPHSKDGAESSEKQHKQPSGSGDKKGKAASIEVFRSQIANIIVQHLNPYRKSKCKTGQITSTEDFKHLARKMTHAIALKELKHCRDGKTLVVSESVKHKTKEYVKKYMAKYTGPYVKSPDDTQL